jgi:hypothetical protein
MRIKKIKVFTLLACILGLTIGSYQLYMYFMAEAFYVKKFRSTHDIQLKKYDPSDPLNLAGFETLHISGSNRPVFEDLKQRLPEVKGKTYIVDLTGGEQLYYRGIYPNEFLGRTHKDQRHFNSKVRRFLVNGFSEFKAEDFVTEEVLAKQYGFEYVKLFNERGLTPRGKMIDDIIKLVESINPEDWLHFHCSAGRGRTTVAMVFVDILKNGRTVPLRDIVRRHHLFGGEDLFDTEVWANGTYTVEKLSRRKQRIMDFYQYVNDPEGYGKRGWVEWCHYRNNDAINDG